MAVTSAMILTAAAAIDPTGSVAALDVDLAALITPSNSTAQIFAGSTYYGVDWPDQGYGSQQVVPFFLGPKGIVDAVDDSADDSRGVVVLSSGWGAGQTGTALAMMQRADDPALDNIELVILDNNSNRAGGGFWTTYDVFAPLLGTSSAPSPSDLGVPVLDVSYEYNINSNASTYPLNLLSDLNSLVAYVYDYGGQATAPVPAGLEPGKHYVLDRAGNVVATHDLPAGTTTTYVTFESDGLPLLRPLRAVPVLGDLVADALEPVSTVLVNAGYKDNSPIPTDPTVTRPAALLPSAAEVAETLTALQDALTEGAAAPAPRARVPAGFGTATPSDSEPVSGTSVSSAKVLETLGRVLSPSGAGRHRVGDVRPRLLDSDAGPRTGSSTAAHSRSADLSALATTTDADSAAKAGKPAIDGHARHRRIEREGTDGSGGLGTPSGASRGLGSGRAIRATPANRYR